MITMPPTPPPGPILGLSVKDDANYRYRTVTPLRGVPGATWATYASVSEAQLRAAETVIINRCAGPVDMVQRMLADLRNRWGVGRILVDYDDTWLIPHPLASVRPKPAIVEGVRYALNHCGGVLVPNSEAQAHYAEHTPAPVAVVPNLFWPDMWDMAAIQPYQPPVILIAGSPSHQYDWDLVLPALIALREQMPHVGLRVLGCPHPALMALRTEGREWTHDLAEYTQLLRGATIALCPLTNTLFNRCKGNAKPGEYSLSAGCAVIGSAIQYGDVLADGRGIVIPDGADPWAWASAIDTYLMDEHRRYADATRLRQHVTTDLNAATWRDQFVSLYTQEITQWQHSLMAPMA